MTNLAIDRFMASPDPRVAAKAEDVLAELNPRPELSMGAHAFMHGWLSASVAEFLEKPLWSRKARQRLAVDLLVAKRYLERTRLATSRSGPKESEVPPASSPPTPSPDGAFGSAPDVSGSPVTSE